MKKIFFMCLMCCSLSAFGQAKLGTYDSTNPQTKGIVKVRITKNTESNQEYIRLYAVCEPNDCYWGRFRIQQRYGYELYEHTKILSQGATWYPKYKPFIIDQGFVKRKVYLSTNTRSKDHIEIIVRSDYKDPKRNDKEFREILKLK